MTQISDTAQPDREAIRAVLETHLPPQGLVLEIASGTGDHAVHMARSFPFVAWQPTDIDPGALAGIAARRAQAELPNLLRPIAMDVTSTPWPIAKADAIVGIDFAHAVPWEAVVAVFERAAFVLSSGAMLHLFGPFRFYGKYAATAIAELDWDLQKRDPQLGVRDLSDLIRLATRTGFGMPRALAIPPHSHALSFKRDAMPPPSGRFLV